MTAVTHAGGVVVRDDGTGARVLVVRSSDGRSWVLPKGHIDPGESAEEAALREVREEAGVVGEIVETLGTDRYTAPANPKKKRGPESIHVVYFEMRFVREVPADEERELRWLSPDDALELVTLPGVRVILAKLRVSLAGARRPQ